MVRLSSGKAVTGNRQTQLLGKRYSYSQVVLLTGIILTHFKVTWEPDVICWLCYSFKCMVFFLKYWLLTESLIKAAYNFIENLHILWKLYAPRIKQTLHVECGAGQNEWIMYASEHRKALYLNRGTTVYIRYGSHWMANELQKLY